MLAISPFSQFTVDEDFRGFARFELIDDPVIDLNLSGAGETDTFPPVQIPIFPEQGGPPLFDMTALEAWDSAALTADLIFLDEATLMVDA